jgi:hypothetical protein
MATKKPAAAVPDPEENALHRKYRPQTLDRVIGQEAAVTRMRGMVNTGKIPNAIAIFGPFSAGKTTLARCLAAAVNEKPVAEQQDYKELNAATQRSIEDVRDLERVSKFKPMGSKRRFILVDEAQQFMSNATAAQGLLKPVEEPSSHTTWIFGSLHGLSPSGTVRRRHAEVCDPRRKGREADVSVGRRSRSSPSGSSCVGKFYAYAREHDPGPAAVLRRRGRQEARPSVYRSAR